MGLISLERSGRQVRDLVHAGRSSKASGKGEKRLYGRDGTLGATTSLDATLREIVPGRLARRSDGGDPPLLKSFRNHPITSEDAISPSIDLR